MAFIDFGSLIGDMAKTGGGFALAGFGGRYIENRFKPNVTSTSSTTDKLIAAVANNAPKVAGYVLFDKIGATKDVAKAMAGSIAFDVIVRFVNQGVNPYNITLGGYRILSNSSNSEEQKLIQENSTLRTQLNQAFQKLANTSPQINSPQINSTARVTGMPFEQYREKTDRERRYGFSAPVNLSPKYDTYGMR